MPDQDNIPISILNQIANYLFSQNINRITINSLSNTISYKEEIRAKSENLPITDILEDNSIHILSSTNADWIFINPFDYCRTIVGATKDFIINLKLSTSLEISELLGPKHRLNMQSQNS